MAQYTKNLSKDLVEQILGFCSVVAGSGKVTAACRCSDFALGLSIDKKTVDVLLVICGFQPRLMSYFKVFDGCNVAILAVDQWVFERDVDRGFLGEALAGGLIFPYDTLVNPEYFREQEIKLKKRLVIELLENLVLGFPELSYEMFIKPEYFMYETMLSRARLFPPTMYSSLEFIQQEGKIERIGRVLNGYLEALKQLEKANVIYSSDGYVKISKEFADKCKSNKVRFTNLFKPAQRTLFASLIGAFPRIMNFLSQNRELLLRLQHATEENSKIINQLEVPQKYLFVSTARGRVSLANRMNVESFIEKAFPTSKVAEVKIEGIGGVLNDVYLIRVFVDGEEKRVVAKQFKDWSSIKWFPLTLWTAGTRTFAVLGRSRLEREIAINQLLNSKGFHVPQILYVSPTERLVFMEYVEGENVRNVIKRLAVSKSSSEVKKDLTIIERLGKRFAKVHAIGVALGDTKPENVMMGKHGEIYLMDFEQAARNGDKVWDVAEFLYYAGHDIPPFVETRTAECITEAFIRGYLEGGGKIETVKKAATAKYTKVFSVFTLPHIMLAVSNICRNADKLKG
ncbi:MAG TPA: AarF/UbiB family protein [Candidatus Bathyarchaeia archaeon]|nr:AarF/UbiB family protein [Candidatus Bathyarchaeia archaeon]